ncbi:hypothetical protein SFIMM107S_00014 [Streptomyces griseus]
MQIGVGGARCGQELRVHLAEDELLAAAGAGAHGAVGAGQAAEPDELELAFRAGAVDVRHVHLALEGPDGDDGFGDELEGVHLRGGHQQQVGAGQGVRPDVLRELDVVADQQADAETVEVGLDDGLLAGGEPLLLEAAEEVGLAVVREARAVGADELGGVEDPLPVALRVAVEDGEAVAYGDLGDGLRAGTVGRLGEYGDGVADGVTGEEQLRRDQQPGSGGGGPCGGLVEHLQVLGDGARTSGALEQGGAQRRHG